MDQRQEELASRLDRAEAVIDALRNSQVDAVVGKEGVLLLRLREMEQQLLASEERFRTVAEQTGEVFWFVEFDPYRLTYLSPAFETVWGLPIERVCEDPALRLSVVHEEDRPVVEEAFSAFRAGRQADYSVEFRIVRPDGTTRWICEKAIAVRDGRGRPLRAGGISQDITDTKRTEVILRESHEQLEQRVRERTAELKDALDRKQTEISRRELAETVMRERSLKLEEMNRELNRRTRQLQALALELTTAEDRERKRLAQVLHDDLQQMLVAVRYQLDTLAKRVADVNGGPETLEQIADVVSESIRKARTLSHDLAPPTLSAQGLLSAMQWLAEQMQQQYSLSVRIAADMDAEPAAESLKPFVFRAVRELLFNVFKHAGAREATVTLRRCAEGLELAVADEGKGFDPASALQDTIGLGLFSIGERLELLGGRLDVHSAPGDGSRVVMFVPDRPEASIQQPGAPTTAGEPGAPSLAKRSAESTTNEAGGGDRLRVLLADDHRVMREGLALLLAEVPDMDIVGEADNGKQAVDLADRLAPDVIVMDMSMPVMDGMEATRIVKRGHPEVRIVGLTMFEQGDVVQAMLDAGADACLSKSGHVEKLLAAIRGEGDHVPDNDT